ncbi:hypothetical protein [Streptomyces sp. NPDC046727]|uniref:hypothetical protein n=1 Tax=Streptomyces sp. NPDC046727 TaxID=3155373 RepID=UPI0033CBDBEB
MLRWLVENTGLDPAALPSPDERHRLAEAFRRDAAASARSWTQLSAMPPDTPLDSPVTLLLAADDPLMRDHERHIHRWARLTRSFAMNVVAHGGHHLNATRPDFLAEQVRKAVGR